MVRSLAKGQFHVTSAWGETALALEPTFLEPPLLEEEDEDGLPQSPEAEPIEPFLDREGMRWRERAEKGRFAAG